MEKSRYGAAIFAVLFGVAIVLLLAGEGLAR
jgi:hypothetical protein